MVFDLPVTVFEDEMPLNETDRGWIKNAIAEALQDRFKGWREYVRLWSLPSVAVAIAIFFYTQWDKYVEFRTHTNDTLVQIQADLRTLQAPQSPGKVLKELAPLPPKEFAQNLSALRKIAEQPVAVVAPTVPTIREISQKLQRTNETTPDYWPTVLQFIKFASAGTSPRVPPPDAPVAMSISGEQTNIEQADAVVVLDGGSLSRGRFLRCRIRFTDRPVKMADTVFIDCVFELPVSDSPSPYLKRVGQSLLASNLSSVNMTVSP